MAISDSSRSKTLKNVRRALALTAADWARRKGMGEKVIARARLYARLAGKRMGDLYARSEKAKGGEQYHKGSTGTRRLPVPTLADLGVSKKEMAEAQFLASLPKDVFEDLLDSNITLTGSKRRAKQKGMAEDAIHHAHCKASPAENVGPASRRDWSVPQRVASETRLTPVTGLSSWPARRTGAGAGTHVCSTALDPPRLTRGSALA
jgi:hypothetical protein